MNIAGYLNQESDRPIQVTYAVFLLTVFLVISSLILIGQTAVSILLRPARILNSVFVISLLITGAAYLTMYFVVTRIAAGKNWARWLLLIGLAVLVIVTTSSMPLLVFGDAVLGLLVFGQVLVTAVAAALLCQRPCSMWFKRVGDYRIGISVQN